MKVLASTTQPPSLGLPTGDLLLNCVTEVLGVCGARSAWAAARPDRASRPSAFWGLQACPPTAGGGRNLVEDSRRGCHGRRASSLSCARSVNVIEEAARRSSHLRPAGSRAFCSKLVPCCDISFAKQAGSPFSITAGTAMLPSAPSAVKNLPLQIILSSIILSKSSSSNDFALNYFAKFFISKSSVSPC